jgi:hypothetical protein
MRTLAEVKQEIEYVKNLIQQHQRNLWKLKEQEALYGRLNVPLHLSNEIEKTEEELAQLSLRLKDLTDEQEFLTAPVVWLANLAGIPESLPSETILIDRSSEFVFEPRQVPPAEHWQTALLPELADLSRRLASARLIRLQGSSCLSSAFAFGQFFRNVGGRRLVVEQSTPTQTLIWTSNAEPLTGEIPPEFKSYTSAINPVATTQNGQPSTDALVIIYALTQTTLAAVVGEIGAYWGEAAAFKQIVTDPINLYMPQHAKGVLVLEAETATQGSHLAGWQAAALARTSRRKLVNFIDQVEPQRLHLFLACPSGLAAFMGHHWNQIGVEIQCYERLNRNHYTPSLALKTVL